MADKTPSLSDLRGVPLMKKIIVMVLLGLAALTGCSSGSTPVDNSVPSWRKHDIANVREQCAHTYPRSVTYDGYQGQYFLYSWRDPVFGIREAAVDSQDPNRSLVTCGA